MFIRAGFDFVIGAFEIFMVVKVMSTMKAKEEKVPEELVVLPELSNKEGLLTEICDALRAR